MLSDNRVFIARIALNTGLIDVGSVRLMAARPYNKRGTEYEEYFDPLGDLNI